MTKTAYINVRVEPKLKREAQKVLREVGVNTSDAIGMFYRQIVMQKGIPFEVRIPNKETLRAIRDLRAGKGTVHAGSTKDIFDAILKGR